MRRSTVFVVSRNTALVAPVVERLERRGYWFAISTDVAEAIAIACDAAVSLIILHGVSSFGAPLLRLYAERRAERTLPPLVVLAESSSEEFAIGSLRAGALDYFAEPIDEEALERCLARAMPVDAVAPQETSLTGGEVLVGSSRAIRNLRVNIRQMAASDCNVLITGETGTGKELVAQLIHQNGARAARPLICINCAAIPDALLESELFGYERGAFTGATGANEGKLMTAHRGTVFFDEIGDMSPVAQAKILRTIESKEVQRLGAVRRYEADFRILAATHHNLDELASTAAFRRDLYFRLNVGRIHLPPLRERKADIASLVDRMISELNRRLGCAVAGVTEAAARTLAGYDWPGNVRELKNVIERVFISRRDGRIVEADLPEMIRPRTTSRPAGIREELCTLKAALVACQGNKSKAAAKLNWSRMTLYRKLARYRLLDDSSGEPRAVAPTVGGAVPDTESALADVALDDSDRSELA